MTENWLFVDVHPEICTLPNLENLSFSGNFFRGEADNCLALSSFGSPFSNTGNYIVGRPVQRLATENNCNETVCELASPPSPSPSPPPPPPPSPPPPSTSPSPSQCLGLLFSLSISPFSSISPTFCKLASPPPPPSSPPPTYPSPPKPPPTPAPPMYMYMYCMYVYVNVHYSMFMDM